MYGTYRELSTLTISVLVISFILQEDDLHCMVGIVFSIIHNIADDFNDWSGKSRMFIGIRRWTTAVHVIFTNERHEFPAAKCLSAAEELSLVSPQLKVYCFIPLQNRFGTQLIGQLVYC